MVELQINLAVNQKLQNFFKQQSAILRIRRNPTPTDGCEFVAELVIGEATHQLNYIRASEFEALLGSKRS